jgi:hypothetical protein
MQLRDGEERTAGSDPRIRFSSGGPISLDPEFVIYFILQYFGGGEGRVGGWGGIDG